MKNISLALLAVVLAAILVFGTVLAAEGGVPWAHGLSGREFGQAVSELAQSEPGAVAEHIQANKDGDKGGSMPAAHGMSGREFGAAVSELAQSEPGAVAEHVRMGKGDGQDDDPSGEISATGEMTPTHEMTPTLGMPALHGMSGREFGAAVSELAKSEPGAVADHVRQNKDSDKDKDKDKDKDGDKGGGVPKAHEMSGREFGDAVSDLAHSEPGAVAEHVRPDK